MAVTNYYSMNGQIIGEKTTGGSRIDYLTDALGSVTATMDQSANIINTYRYKPYGGLLAKTGGGADPAFQWVGSPGYRQTGKSYAEVYVRARHYSTVQGRWTTRDPMGSRSGANRFVYGRNAPAVDVDPSGLLSIQAQKLVGECGKLLFYVTWVLPPGARRRGYVVQHIINRFHVRDCFRPNRLEKPDDYWEAWWFDSVGDLQPVANIGNLTCGVSKRADCHDKIGVIAMPRTLTLGSYEHRGEVKYMEDYVLDKRDNWRQVPSWTGMPIYSTRFISPTRVISGWNEPRYGEARSLILRTEWHCCDPENKIDVVFTVPGCTRRRNDPSIPPPPGPAPHPQPSPVPGPIPLPGWPNPWPRL